jgi:hypothetical protein
MNFNQYLTISELTEKAGAMLVPESWKDDIAKMLPQMDLDLPQITKSGSIQLVLQKQNPIYVQLSDGTKLFFTVDEFRRIKEKPEVGKNMTVVFQRLDKDKTDMPSQLVKAICH